MRFVDMHCHLDRMTNGVEIAQEGAARGIGFFCTTVTPQDAVAAAERFRDIDTVRIGAGLHPWWLADGSCRRTDVAALERLVAPTRFIGEVGMDAGKRGAASVAFQEHAFRCISQAVTKANQAGAVISIHAVRAVTPVLNILEETGLTEHAACILHWFSGTSDELQRAVRLGCLFSINERMLATKRGREYARVIPDERLLLETDAPPELDTPYSLTEIEGSLARTLTQLAAIRLEDTDGLAERVASRSSKLLRFD